MCSKMSMSCHIIPKKRQKLRVTFTICSDVFIFYPVGFSFLFFFLLCTSCLVQKKSCEHACVEA